MKVLVTGASGYLGQFLLQALAQDEGIELVAAYGSLPSFKEEFGAMCACCQVDLTDSAATAAFVQEQQPSALVNLAAISSPAACEKDRQRARAINCPLALLEALPPTCAVIFLSTDQVYDGVSAPYSEGVEALPVNLYGETKLDFERALHAARPTRAVSLRSSLICGPRTPGTCRKQSFLQFCHERLSAGQPTDFFHDEWRSAVFVHDVVAVIRWFLRGGCESAPGVYNMGGPERVNRLQLAQEVARCCDLDATNALGLARASLPPGGVSSPADISMDSAKLARVSGLQLRGLAEMVRLSLRSSGDDPAR